MPTTEDFNAACQLLLAEHPPDRRFASCSETALSSHEQSSLILLVPQRNLCPDAIACASPTLTVQGPVTPSKRADHMLCKSAADRQGEILIWRAYKAPAVLVSILQDLQLSP